ncbi:DUF2147 domain-containing protein [Flavobacterium algicola]|uniref:DUF2147 domain-containing protein n=1 Tax=Flavobacterium algicola TaxID=556529 RepID=UPI001EFD3E1B|nr:DUF2147 domain-containing protein [Flavobacterium algicola]MCG9793566.1 DUF2147 domain-containing protein [Flavobacterium algicola]
MIRNSVAIILLFVTTTFYSQDVVGKWKNIDDETGKSKGVVEIYKKSGKIYGKVISILVPGREDALCQNCQGEDADKPILGLTIIKGLVKDGKEYNSGEILDPTNGKLYRCLIELKEKDKLKVRGYIGFALFGRTQYWYRVK